VTTNNARGSVYEASRAERTADSPLERVFLEQYPRVLSVLVRLVGDRAEAEDLALETFWRLHQQPPRRRNEHQLGGWLYRVATNLGLNALRARRRRERYELEGGQMVLVQNHADDPVESLAAEEERAGVRQVLAQMDERQAQLLLMRHSGMAYAELAAALGVSPHSIGSLLVRAEREFERRYREVDR
jgi:RNA polymerase sigma-70 factor, ECF subfamily